MVETKRRRVHQAMKRLLFPSVWTVVQKAARLNTAQIYPRRSYSNPHIQFVVRPEVVIVGEGDGPAGELLGKAPILTHQHRRLVGPASGDVVFGVPTPCQTTQQTVRQNYDMSDGAAPCQTMHREIRCQESLPLELC
jgi:hypothetical protein